MKQSYFVFSYSFRPPVDAPEALEEALRGVLSEKDWDVTDVKMEMLSDTDVEYTFHTNKRWNDDKKRGFYITKYTYGMLNTNIRVQAKNRGWKSIPTVRSLLQYDVLASPLFKTIGITNIAVIVRFKRFDTQLELPLNIDEGTSKDHVLEEEMTWF